jgi:hypothetical protein
MIRSIQVAAFLLAAAQLDAQAVTWRRVGAPPGAPPGCSIAMAAASIDAFFAAMQTADSTALAHATAPIYAGRFTFSTGKFTPADSFVLAHGLPDLLAYARTRARRHEHITVQQVAFNEWRGTKLEFGPIYFLRSATDLGSAARPGIGKGEYVCRTGISVLNTGPRPAIDPGPGS